MRGRATHTYTHTHTHTHARAHSVSVCQHAHTDKLGCVRHYEDARTVQCMCTPRASINTRSTALICSITSTAVCSKAAHTAQRHPRSNHDESHATHALRHAQLQLVGLASCSTHAFVPEGRHEPPWLRCSSPRPRCVGLDRAVLACVTLLLAAAIHTKNKMFSRLNSVFVITTVPARPYKDVAEAASSESSLNGFPSSSSSLNGFAPSAVSLLGC